MNKTYHLSTCDTCARILEETGITAKGFELQCIKTQKITPAQLDQMRKLAGSYEALFSRRSMKFRPMGLADKQLTEEDYRKLILEEYTFLKRPVTIAGNRIFVGNEKKTVAALKQFLLTNSK
ncbi:arsenate reductase [Chitinophaga alhagiae]|uniref:Arsenate reductase n=1 Tax=Chitinophaga alhagiae TaxID=2203219 RepID=A0ABN5LQJ7_9BACT|nr:ArsC/Spx/MgsR family protein [Chitinophaga alhagiae]AWO01574.1 arsenate reductase [Chitinophaga alhagiae]